MLWRQTYFHIAPVLQKVLAHCLQQKAVLLAICKLLLVVRRLQHEVRYIHDTDHPAPQLGVRVDRFVHFYQARTIVDEHSALRSVVDVETENELKLFRFAQRPNNIHRKIVDIDKFFLRFFLIGPLLLELVFFLQRFGLQLQFS